MSGGMCRVRVIVNSSILFPLAGQERYYSITQRFFTDIHGVMLVYDETEPNSFQELETFWLPDAISHTQNLHPNGIPMFIVANKSDRSEDRTVLFKNAVELSRNRHLLPPIQCSAKTGHSVDVAFEQLASEMLRMQLGTEVTKNRPLKTIPQEKKRFSICW